MVICWILQITEIKAWFKKVTFQFYCKKQVSWKKTENKFNFLQTIKMNIAMSKEENNQHHLQIKYILNKVLSCEK